jgi:hypothetical protein
VAVEISRSISFHAFLGSVPARAAAYPQFANAAGGRDLIQINRPVAQVCSQNQPFGLPFHMVKDWVSCGAMPTSAWSQCSAANIVGIIAVSGEISRPGNNRYRRTVLPRRLSGL